MRLDGGSAVPGVFLAGTVLLAACSLNPKQDPTRYYVLTSVGEDSGLWAAAGLTGTTLDEAVESAGAELDITLGVGPITLSSYLRRSRIVTREANNELRFHETERWGEPLQEALQYKLAENLGTLRAGRPVMYPWYAAKAPDYSVAVDIVRFERDTAGAVTIAYRWRILDAEGRVVHAERQVLASPAAGGTIAASVHAQSEQLATLSRDIADALRRLAS